MSIGYRRDIDGLRALAVTLVVIFHAFPDSLPGGFIGVDIFFVISGFLISSIILRELRAGTFSFLNFYARRVRRIFPALILLLAANLIAGWFFLFSDEYRRLGRHVFGGAAFVSNFFLWAESGYFDSSAETKPLLHLWSLAIEEQFYLLYPLLLWLIFRKRAPLGIILCGLATASFCLGVLLLALRHDSAAFYLPGSRLCELLLGGILALRNSGSNRASTRVNTIAATVGSALILMSAFLLDRTSSFPGFNAIPPVLGACLLLKSLPQAFAWNRLFGSPAAVAIGLVSYPLYLWHWSLLSFARILGHSDTSTRIVLVIVSIALATLTYWYVEKPFRARAASGWPIGALSLCMVMVGGAGLVVQANNGFTSRPANDILGGNLEQLRTDIKPPKMLPCASNFNLSFDSYCAMTRPGPATFAFLGDSHAQDKFPGIASVDTRNNWLLIGNKNCPPLMGIEVKNWAPCPRRAQENIEFINSNKEIRTVVLTFMGVFLLDEPFAAEHMNSTFPRSFVIHSSEMPNASKAEVFERGLDQSISALERAGKRVVLVVDGPELPFLPRDCVRSGWSTDACRVTRETTLRRQETLRAMVAHLQRSHPEMRVFDSLDLWCKREFCQTVIDDKLLFSDSHHLSEFGSRVFAEAFLRWLERG